MQKIILNFSLNGAPTRCEIDENARLLDVLRDVLGQTGTKEGCGVGECGACTVILNGDAVDSCLVLAATVEGKQILTIEGLAKEDQLDPLQTAVLNHHALQCGFCTPGFIMSAKALLDKNPHPTREEIKIAISGNLCRCTGYQQLIEAFEEAAETYVRQP